MRSLFFALLFSAFVFVGAPQAAHAEEAAKPSAAGSAFTDAQRTELTSLIRQFIVDNPQALIASVESFYNKQNEEKAKQEGKLDKVPSGLYDAPLTPSIGPKDAKTTVVYFFDYNCGFCKQVDTDFSRLISEEKNVRFLFKDLPILNESSELAARWALAADKQGKYMDFHNALMQRSGSIDEAALTALAKEKGLDAAKLKVDAADSSISEALQKNLDLARSVGVRGTPFFLFGKEKVPGAISYSKMKELVTKERDGIVVPQAAKDAAAAQIAEGQAAKDTAAASGVDIDTQAEIDRARAEAKQMMGEITKEAGIPNPMEGKKPDVAASVAGAKKKKK